MMRILLAFTIGICFSHDATAQFNGHAASMDPFVRGLLKAQYAHAPATKAKTTAIQQRLVGRAEYDAMTGAIADSFSVSYRSMRGSAFNAEFMDYGQWIGPGFPGFADMIFAYNSDGRRYNRNMGPDVLGDTFRQYSFLPVPPYAFGHYADQYHLYDGDNNLLDEFWDGDVSVGGNAIEFVLHYNSISNIVRASHLLGSSAGMDTLETAFFKYNTAGQLVMDSICEYTSISATYESQKKYDYSYDGTGNMILGRSWEWDGSCWVADKSYAMTYYAGTHQLKTCTIDTLLSGGLPETIDSFGYSTGFNYTTYSKHTDYTLPGGPHVYEEKRHIGIMGLPDTIHAYDWSMGNHKMYVYSYNAYNNPVRRMDYDSSASSPSTNTMAVYYYYEPYGNVGISDAASANGGIVAYPNPVCSTLYIKHNSTISEPVTVSICNTAGATIKTTVLNQSKGTNEIPVNGLVPGMYIVYIEHDGVVETQQIIKL